MKSWKTTTGGVILIIMAVLQAAKAMIDGDAIDVGIISTQIIAGVGLIMGRDNDKSSEDVGAK